VLILVLILALIGFGRLPVVLIMVLIMVLIGFEICFDSSADRL